MAPLTLNVLLLLALLPVQVVAIAATLRHKMWRALPAWSGYLLLATAHLSIGVFGIVVRQDYPLSLLYFEPLFILGQISFTFESSVKFFGMKLGSGSPESRLLMWVIALVPAGIVMPIEIGFVHDALSSWKNHEDESLKLVYDVRRFLSITLLVVLAAIPMVARVGKKTAKPAVVFHHYIVTAYVACAALGYLCKAHSSGTADYYLTILFFIFGPLVCFILWSWKMWRCQPLDFEPVDGMAPNDVSDALSRDAFQHL